MSDQPIETLSAPLLRQVPEPFFTEYIKHHKIHDRNYDGARLDIMDIAAQILLKGGTGNPMHIPVLATHIAKTVDGVLHIKYRTASDYTHPEVVGSFPIEHLPEPEDDYSDNEEAPKAQRTEQEKRKIQVKVKQREAGKGVRAPSGPVMMDFVFPPVGRRTCHPTQADLEDELAGETTAMREPLPEDFLGAMMNDLQEESERAVKMFFDAEDSLKEAFYAYECMRLEMEEEQQAWKSLWGYIESVAGKEVAEDLQARTAMRVNGEISPYEAEQAIAEGDIPDPEADNEWKTRVAEPVSPPKQVSPGPDTTFAAARTPAPPVDKSARADDPAPRRRSSTATVVVPALPPPINLNFGGNATSFDKGSFLKRRRDSDVESDSESDTSEGSPPPRASARKRSLHVSPPPRTVNHCLLTPKLCRILQRLAPWARAFRGIDILESIHFSCTQRHLLTRSTLARVARCFSACFPRTSCTGYRVTGCTRDTAGLRGYGTGVR
ncbi:hypothetical protein C8R47DRAFT_654878 [Mycena vitilis]|nr:hypothetical protein C8R47DRAFT_654878 [Mycena vitilis]